MNVRTLCLSILFEKDASGYEIRQLCTHGECAYFVEVSFGSIYPALAKMQKEGLLTSQIQEQQGRPAKKIYKITNKGKEEFRASLFEKLNDDVFRSEFLLFARFAHLLPAPLVKQRLLERLKSLEVELENLENIKINSNKSTDAWIVNYGLNIHKVEIQYIRTYMNELVNIAQAEEQNPKKHNQSV